MKIYRSALLLLVLIPSQSYGAEGGNAYFANSQPLPPTTLANGHNKRNVALLATIPEEIHPRIAHNRHNRTPQGMGLSICSTLGIAVRLIRFAECIHHFCTLCRRKKRIYASSS